MKEAELRRIEAELQEGAPLWTVPLDPVLSRRDARRLVAEVWRLRGLLGEAVFALRAASFAQQLDEPAQAEALVWAARWDAALQE